MNRLEIAMLAAARAFEELLKAWNKGPKQRPRKKITRGPQSSREY